MSEYNRRPDVADVEPESGETRGSPAGSQSDGSNQAREYAGQAREKAQEYSGQAREKAQEYGDQAREKAQEYGDQAREKAEAGKDQAADRMERTAEMMREKTGDSSGTTGEAGVKVADSMETAASYLRDHNTADMWTDMEAYAKDHPGQAVAGAVLAGFVLGRIIR